MAPKRVSPRIALPREAGQLDPRKFSLLEQGMKFRPVPCGGSGEKKYYRLRLENADDNIVTLASLEEELFLRGLRVSMVENVLNTLFEILPKYIARTGNAVRLGNLVTLKPYATGSIAHMNDCADPERNHVEIRAVETPALRCSLEKAHLVNTMRRVKGIDDITGGPKSRSCEVDEAHDVVVNGRNIYLPHQSADDPEARGRAWLETRSGEKIGRFDVVISGNELLKLKLHLDKSAPTKDDLRLVIETYGTEEAAADPAAPINSYCRNVKLVSHG